MTEIERFPVNDADGNRYMVIVYQRHTLHAPLKGRARDIPAGTELALSDGRHVNEIDGRLFIVNDHKEEDDEIWRVDQS